MLEGFPWNTIASVVASVAALVGIVGAFHVPLWRAIKAIEERITRVDHRSEDRDREITAKLDRLLDRGHDDRRPSGTS